MPHVAMQQWSRGVWIPGKRRPWPEDLRLQMEELTEPNCGPVMLPTGLGWFGEGRWQIAQFALVRLGSAPDAKCWCWPVKTRQRFTQKWAHLYLKRVGDSACPALQRSSSGGLIMAVRPQCRLRELPPWPIWSISIWMWLAVERRYGDNTLLAYRHDLALQPAGSWATRLSARSDAATGAYAWSGRLHAEGLSAGAWRRCCRPGAACFLIWRANTS